MNAVFCLLFLVSTVFLLFTAPDSFLPILLSGGEKASSLCLFLLASYAVWMGFFALLKEVGLDKTIAKLFRPILRLLFVTRDEDTLFYLSGNLSANLLGLAAATPLGIEAAKRMRLDKDRAMLFVLNATSLQVLPTTVLSLRAEFSCASPSDIVLPTLLSTLVSTVLGVLLTKVVYR